MPSSGGHEVKHSYGLEGFRAGVLQRAVPPPPLAVVVGFDVFKHGFMHLGAADEALADVLIQHLQKLLIGALSK